LARARLARARGRRVADLPAAAGRLRESCPRRASWAPELAPRRAWVRPARGCLRAAPPAPAASARSADTSPPGRRQPTLPGNNCGIAGSEVSESCRQINCCRGTVQGLPSRRPSFWVTSLSGSGDGSCKPRPVTPLPKATAYTNQRIHSISATFAHGQPGQPSDDPPR
jgi:hypothetical protein